MTETVFTLFGRPVTGYGLGCAVTAAVVLLATGLLAAKRGIRPAFSLRFSVLAVPMTLLFSRLLYIIGDLTTLQTISQMLRFWDGGYSMVGAIIGIILAALLAEKLWKLPKHHLADSLAMALPIGVVMLRCLEDGTRLGTSKPLAFRALTVLLEVDPMESILPPAWLLEAVAAVVIMIALAALSMRRTPPGDTLLCFLTFFGCSQLVLECLRSDAHMTVHFVPIQQVVALGFVLVALLVWSVRAAKSGQGRQVLFAWIITAVCSGLAIWGEFKMDRSDNKLLGYALMVGAVIVICTTVMHIRRLANRSAVR